MIEQFMKKVLVPVMITGLGFLAGRTNARRFINPLPPAPMAGATAESLSTIDRIDQRLIAARERIGQVARPIEYSVDQWIFDSLLSFALEIEKCLLKKNVFV